MHDLVIVGGGLIGLGVAFEAQKRGMKTLVLDAKAQGAATQAAAGMLAPISEMEWRDPRFLAVAKDALEAMKTWLPEIAERSGHLLDASSPGTLWVAQTRDDEEAIEHLAMLHQAAGVGGRLASRDELRTLEPSLTPRVTGAYVIANESAIDPRALHRALAEAFVRAGGAIESANADALWMDDERAVGVRTDRGAFGAARTLIAAGAWSEKLLADHVEFRVRPVKGQTLILQGIRRILEHTIRTPEIYVVPRPDGRVVVGASSEEAGFDASARAGVIFELLREALRVVPELAECELIDCPVGFRPALLGTLPALGKTRTEGLFVATGHGRNGVLLSALTARSVAAHLADGTAIPKVLSAMRYEDAS